MENNDIGLLDRNARMVFHSKSGDSLVKDGETSTTEGQDGDIIIRRVNDSLRLYIRDRNQWYYINSTLQFSQDKCPWTEV